ncbi:MAG: 2Fe-2S iron-sulfur cluster-binding protein [Steroidobacteraceae bacterium]
MTTLREIAREGRAASVRVVDPPSVPILHSQSIDQLILFVNHAPLVRLVFITHTGERVEVDANPGGSVMQAARQHNVPGIEADCSGSMVCGTCHVVIDPEWHDKLPRQSSDERELLEYVPLPQPNTRLTCQIPLSADLDGLVMRIPRDQR